MIDLSQQELNQCVNYFIQGGVVQWAGGALTLGILVVTAFTKHSIPSFVTGLRDMLIKPTGDEIKK